MTSKIIDEKKNDTKKAFLYKYKGFEFSDWKGGKTDKKKEPGKNKWREERGKYQYVSFYSLEYKQAIEQTRERCLCSKPAHTLHFSPPTKRVHYSLWPQRSTVVGDLRAAYLPPRTHHLGKQSRMRRECPKCKPSLHCWLPGTSQCTTVGKFNLHLWTWFLVRGSDYYKPRCFFWQAIS